jgi:hypothetical protein
MIGHRPSNFTSSAVQSFQCLDRRPFNNCAEALRSLLYLSSIALYTAAAVVVLWPTRSRFPRRYRPQPLQLRLQLHCSSLPFSPPPATQARPRRTMDIVLELFDTYGFDALYATLLPAKTGASPNATYSSAREIPTASPPSAWQWQPASQYLSFQPRDSAWQSSVPRDDWRRQLFTLYLITW